jgi:glycosyltransferase involved in cell wall biosynthesis
MSEESGGREIAVDPQSPPRPTSGLESPGSTLVSVCISAYNVERYLREALDSILAQTYRELEIILVDNGSVDGTYDVAQSIRDERFRCFRLPENIGGYQAMNMVAGMARGDLVAVYHSDDVYEPTIVEAEVGYLESHPEAGAVFTMCHFIDEEGTIYDALDLPAELAGREHVNYEDVFPAMLRHGNVMLPCPTFMVRREVLHEVGPFDAERWDIAADQEMWLRLTRQYPVGILDQRLLRYRTTPHQWTRRWKRLRTEPDRAIEVMELYLDKDGWRARLPRAELVELRYLRCDDETTRAANAVILGETAAARKLLKGRYPYAGLFSRLRRRKVRVLLLRALMKTALALGAGRPLGRLLRGTEYGEWR